MKTKILQKKLSLRKVTVVNLGNEVMGRVMGGAETRMPHLCTDYSYCEETCTTHLSAEINCLDTDIQCSIEPNTAKCSQDCTQHGMGDTGC